jgi:dTDP-L-rhamnose 4-epimerase
MRILVTGGAGFIGSTIVDQLVDRGHDVTVVDALLEAAHQGKPAYLNDQASYTWGDLADADVAEDAVVGVDAVCHQASMVGLGVDFADISAYVRHNDAATASLLAALHRRAFAGRLVLASSMVVYGEGRYRCATHGPVPAPARTVDDLDAGSFDPRCPQCGSPLVDELLDEGSPLEPRTIYAATKAHQEHLCAAYGREHHSAVIALRYHNVYGPRMPRHTPYAGVASLFADAARHGRRPVVFEDGGQRRDFVHVHDVARANVAAVEADGVPSTALNIASGEPHTVLDLASAISATIAGSPSPCVSGRYRLGDVRHLVASPARAARELGFVAEVRFVDGITQLANENEER